MYFFFFFYEFCICFFFFFFNDTATTEIYTLSLHDALPISSSTFSPTCARAGSKHASVAKWRCGRATTTTRSRSEEHTSELQSHSDLVCRLLLEKKKKIEHQERVKATEIYGVS